MGKSFVCSLLEKEGIEVFSADNVVADLLSNNGKVINRVKQEFSEICENGTIDKSKLAEAVFVCKHKLNKLEQIIYPELEKRIALFLGKARAQKKQMVALEIPLLFEKGYEKYCDVVAVVIAPKFLQKKRAILRKNMTNVKFQAILSNQWPDCKKSKRANYIIHTGLNKGLIISEIKCMIYKLIGKSNA